MGLTGRAAATIALVGVSLLMILCPAFVIYLYAFTLVFPGAGSCLHTHCISLLMDHAGT